MFGFYFLCCSLWTKKNLNKLMGKSLELITLMSLIYFPIYEWYHSTLIYNKLCKKDYKIVLDFSCFVNNRFFFKSTFCRSWILSQSVNLSTFFLSLFSVHQRLFTLWLMIVFAMTKISMILKKVCHSYKQNDSWTSVTHFYHTSKYTWLLPPREAFW